MITLYVLCTVTGAAFVVFSNVLGHMVGGDHGAGGHGGGGHGASHDAQQGGHDGLPLLSPTAMAAYVTGFGSAGLALAHFGVVNPLIQVPIALGFAGAFGVGLVATMAKLSRQAEGNSLSRLDDLVGQEVEVTIAIPAAGSGEVAFVSGGTRLTATAQSEAGQTFAQGSRVRVTRVTDGTLRVTLLPALGASAVVSVGEPIPTPPHKDPIR
jgi:membrane protein implicated in regulation of membrane protease activity